jgi:phage-related protein
MGFGKFLKDTLSKVGNGIDRAVQWAGNGIQQVAEVARPFAGMAADVVSTFNPRVGQGIRTGFDVIDGASRGVAQGGLGAAMAGGVQGGINSILNRGREPPEVWQDDED